MSFFLRETFRVYLVQQGDSLWNIAKRFDMNHRALAKINGLNAAAILQVGQLLKVKVFSSRELALNLPARSRANHPAYGLMQLVPQTAGEEAYYRIYGQRRKLTPHYLYDPDRNIELGTAYLHLLNKVYMGSISDPISRTYCVVAAYHAGPSNVGRAFLPEASIKQATPIINSLEPADVYKRLVEGLPSMESRNYVSRVIKRVSRYSGWYPENKGDETQLGGVRAQVWDGTLGGPG